MKILSPLKFPDVNHHCSVVTAIIAVADADADAAGTVTGDLGNKPIPTSNTPDNMIKMITAFPSFIFLLLLFLLTLR